MNKKKFVKRYPRALVQVVKFKGLPMLHRVHILTHPTDTPQFDNFVAAAFPEDLHTLYPEALGAVDTHRNEPS
jgi:hypothetical protein